MRRDAVRRRQQNASTCLHVQLAAPLELCGAPALTAVRVSCDRAFGAKGRIVGAGGQSGEFSPAATFARMSRSGCCIRGFIFERTHALPCAGVTR